jgi:hypothetical protein
MIVFAPEIVVLELIIVFVLLIIVFAPLIITLEFNVVIVEFEVILEEKMLILLTTFAIKLFEVIEELEVELIVTSVTLIVTLVTESLLVKTTRFEELYLKAVFEVTIRVFEAVTLPPRISLIANKVFAPKYPFTVPLPFVNPPIDVLSVVTAFVDKTAIV